MNGWWLSEARRIGGEIRGFSPKACAFGNIHRRVLKLFGVLEGLQAAGLIHFAHAAQGIEFRRPLKTSPVLEQVLHDYRKEVPFIGDDVVMYKEIHKTVAFLKRMKVDNL